MLIFHKSGGVPTPPFIDLKTISRLNDSFHSEGDMWQHFCDKAFEVISSDFELLNKKFTPNKELLVKKFTGSIVGLQPYSGLVGYKIEVLKKGFWEIEISNLPNILNWKVIDLKNNEEQEIDFTGCENRNLVISGSECSELFFGTEYNEVEELDIKCPCPLICLNQLVSNVVPYMPNQGVIKPPFEMTLIIRCSSYVYLKSRYNALKGVIMNKAAELICRWVKFNDRVSPQSLTLIGEDMEIYFENEYKKGMKSFIDSVKIEGECFECKTAISYISTIP
jgi:hypothetical protein